MITSWTRSACREEHESQIARLIEQAYPYRSGEAARADGTRRVALDGREVLGYAALWPVPAPRFRIDVIVSPPRRRSGIGAALLDQVLATAEAMRARTVQARVMASDGDGLDFAVRRGFVETMRMHHLELEVAEARLDEHRGVPAGITILPLRAAHTRADYRELVIAAHEGWPDPDPDRPGDPPTIVDWEAILADQQDPHALVAVEDGRFVGFTSALGTGVHPEQRGRGIATALKVAAIDAAIRRGDTTMTSATGNDAMLRVNQKLGYRERWCEVRLVRRLARRAASHHG